VYKRALMLTAATVALLSGPAYAQTDITTKVTTPQQTSTDGDITIDTNGSVVIPSSSNTSTAPAIEVNSSNSVNILTAGGGITYTNTTGAVGVQLDTAGNTGEVIDAGVINLSGSGNDKIGILIGNPAATTTGTFTGLVDTTNFPTLTTPTAVTVLSGSTLQVQGDGSTGIQLTTGDTLNGNISIGGAILVTSTSATALTGVTPVNGVDIAGTMNGTLTIAQGGSVITTGAGAQGLEILGTLNGAFTNFGNLTAEGDNTASTAAATGNPEGGSALIVSGNVTGGIYNAGPANATDATIAAAINGLSNVSTVEITPGFQSLGAVPITIGGYTDTQGAFGTVSFLNRGAISGVPSNANDNASAITIAGVGNNGVAAEEVTLSHGFVNAGTISATATNTSAAIATTMVSGVSIQGYTTLANSSQGYAFINANESAPAKITASETGAAPALVTALSIGQYANVPSLNNAGTISASASSSDPTIANLSAWAVLDNSGTLLNIVNSGSITATASATNTNGTTALDNNNQVAIALDLRQAQGNITINDSGTIGGDVLLGQGNDTIILGAAPASLASIGSSCATCSETINFGGGNDTLTLNNNSFVSGNILEENGGSIAITIASAATLNVRNNGLVNTNDGGSSVGTALPPGTSPGLEVSTLDVKGGGTLGLTLAEPFNTAVAGNVGPIVDASTSITLEHNSNLNIAYGSFISASNQTPGQFVIFNAPLGQLQIVDPAAIENDITAGIPFLFSGNVAEVNTATNSQLVLSLTPKCAVVIAGSATCTAANSIGLTGYAATMFPFANQALANDGPLGGAVVSAGLGLTGANIQAQGQQIYQDIYAEFAPDVTGASRAIGISLTDQATGPVGARQRALRMYAGQDGEATLWGQEFAQRIDVSSKVTSGGYNDTGFGFVMGMDTGDKTDGRYGGAFTFFSGDTAEKSPRDSTTNSEWYMFTGYTDWRGKGMFFDSQLSAGYGTLDGKRFLNIDLPGGTTFSRTAEGKRATEFLAGGLTTGFIANSGGTVFIPQISIDGLTMREEGYAESNNNATTPLTDGFDLSVRQSYANSLRGFVGADLRQDLNFGIFYLQPELRAGYRYDFLSGAEKLTANFLSVPTSTFTITGPDPSQGNLVLGGGIAVTTGAWSLGVNYDYKRGIGGTGGIDQTGTFTLIGRI